jgi:hypothetical protein
MFTVALQSVREQIYRVRLDLGHQGDTFDYTKVTVHNASSIVKDYAQHNEPLSFGLYDTAYRSQFQDAKVLFKYRTKIMPVVAGQTYDIPDEIILNPNPALDILKYYELAFAYLTFHQDGEFPDTELGFPKPIKIFETQSADPNQEIYILVSSQRPACLYVKHMDTQYSDGNIVEVFAAAAGALTPLDAQLNEQPFVIFDRTCATFFDLESGTFRDEKDYWCNFNVWNHYLVHILKTLPATEDFEVYLSNQHEVRTPPMESGGAPPAKMDVNIDSVTAGLALPICGAAAGCPVPLDINVMGLDAAIIVPIEGVDGMHPVEITGVDGGSVLTDEEFPESYVELFTTKNDNVKDLTIKSTNPNVNFNADTTIMLGTWGINESFYGLLKMDILNTDNPIYIPQNSEILEAKLFLWIDNGDMISNNSFKVWFELLERDWIEVEATWNIWKVANNWSTAGALHANDCEQFYRDAYKIIPKVPNPNGYVEFNVLNLIRKIVKDGVNYGFKIKYWSTFQGEANHDLISISCHDKNLGVETPYLEIKFRHPI